MPDNVCLPPFSITNNSLLLSLNTWYNSIMFGCWSLLRCFIYLWIDSSLCQSKENIFSYVFTAYAFEVFLWHADDTTEKQPLPICDIILKSDSMLYSDKYLSKHSDFSPLLFTIEHLFWYSLFPLLFLEGIDIPLAMTCWVSVALAKSIFLKGIRDREGLGGWKICYWWNVLVLMEGKVSCVS